MPLTNYPGGLSSFGIPVLGGAGIPFTGKYFFVDPVNGSDGNTGLKPSKAFATLYKAISMMTSGNNDVCYLIGNGASTGTARLSKALAQVVTPAATTGVLNWNKDACHLIGITAPTLNARCRIAPVATDTITLFGSGNFVTVSGNGCLFQNISAFHGFATGGASQIAWTDSGGRNCYVNCSLQGMGDSGSAATTTGRSLLITGSTGEHTFIHCVIGLDTQPRSTGASEIEFAAGSPRNRFFNCVIETNSAAGADFWIKVGASGLDRYALFSNCTFSNPITGGPGAQALTTGASMNASPGGVLLLQNCLIYGATAFDTASKSLTNIANAATAGGRVAVAYQ